MDSSTEQCITREAIAALAKIHNTATIDVAALEPNPTTGNTPIPTHLRNSIIRNYNILRAAFTQLRKPNPRIASFIRVAKAATRVVIHELRTNAKAAQITTKTINRYRRLVSSVGRIEIVSKIPLATTHAEADVLVHAVDYHDALRDIQSARAAISSRIAVAAAARASHHRQHRFRVPKILPSDPVDDTESHA